ncbi:phenylalanine--tRNA ligase subunit beta [Agrococcus sp. SGAir0287]|uniref:phenylalanine--tRNA ligase subunit beta n=1 Tax=Agrococcus sp. SGAir0287 TaxID=2070347 RepID=UPI0010CD1D7E|nr:phenylalanine--tRNA ligase subunit beta [Agrococcus sp. SGAir0287]QCR19596.1 phenylalanine--tRNA ligase subunit beta [Agrococcus sp. SGAir0287]
MRAPMSWLAELVDVPAGTTGDDVHAALVRVGLEEEALHGGDVTGPLVVGRVLSFDEEPQKNGKTIRWVQVDVGEEEPRGIVCGAANFHPDDLVVVSLPGAVLPGGFAISARKTYGHVSDGMIASERELGLGDDHDGILRLNAKGYDAEPGDDALALLGLDDVAVEVNVTPDRGYVLSMRGMARELALSTGWAYRDPAAIEAGEGSGFPVTVADDAPIRGIVGCGRFVARAVRGIDATRATPRWMQQRLTLAGMRPISIAVDVTNYVMLELGQPIHGYDLDLLQGGITVRRAQAGETLVTLDGATRTLDPEDLLICDDMGPVGLAGVMGGDRTEMSERTTDVLVESAWFHGVSVARTARRHRLWSEASKRFERGVDPALQAVAAQRVVDLLVELAGGTADPLGASVGDVPAPPTIAFAPQDAARITGADYTDAETRDALVRIGATVQDADGAAHVWRVTPPTWRPDLTERVDLVEEAARVVGYDRIPSVLPSPPSGRGLTRPQRLRRNVANALAASGLTEVLVAPFQAEADARRVGVEPVRLANPLDERRPFLRTSLVPGLVETAQRNVGRGLTDLALFELGTVFRVEGEHGTDAVPAGAVRPDDAVLASLDALPVQPRHVGALLLGARIAKQPGQQREAFGVADAIDVARRVARTLGLAVDVRQAQRDWLHPGRTAEVLLDGAVVGVAGELLPSLATEADLPRQVAIVELDLDALVASARTSLDTAVIGATPAATQDLSVVVDADVPAGEVLAAVREGAGALLEHVALVDDYRGADLAGRKSLTFALRFRDAERTLTAAQATEAKLAGLALATERTGATLRE